MQQTPQQGDPRSDADLISSVRLGDLAAYGVLFSRHAPAVTAVARYYARDSSSADDLVSEAFERTMGVLRSGGGPDVSFRAYLYTVVRRLSYEQDARSSRTRVTDDFTAFEMPEETLDPSVTSYEQQLVTGAFATLPERWQAVLWYLEVEEMSPADIAPLLGLTANGVSALAYRAREGLRQAYLQRHVTSEPSREACEQFRGSLGAYARNKLAKRETTKIDEHLDECEECTAIVAELRDTSHGLRVIIAPLLLGGVAAAGLGFAGPPSSAAASALPAVPKKTGRVVTAALVAMAAIALTGATLAVLNQPPPPIDSSQGEQEEPPPRPPTPPTPTVAPTPGPTPTPEPPAPVTKPNRPVTPPTTPPPAPTVALGFEDVGALVLGRDGMVGVNLKNTGPTTAANPSIVITLPEGVIVDEARSLRVSSTLAWTCAPHPLGLTCGTSQLPGNSASSIYLPVKVSPAATLGLSASATVSAAGLKSVTANGTATVMSRGLGTRFIIDGRHAATSVGASFLSCNTAQIGCSDARNRQGDPALLDNNSWAMLPVDEAGMGAPSSTAQLDLPVGAQVGFAGLYWSGLVPPGASDADLGQLQLRNPVATVTAVTATRVDRSSVSPGGNYQSFADVTAVVAAGGAGQWAASGAQLLGGIDSYAGWSLVVVYQDSQLAPGRVAVFDGFEPVTSDPVSFVVAGLANSTVDVNVVAWEGDASLAGDSLGLDGTLLVRNFPGAASTNAFASVAAGSAVLNSFGVDVGAFLPATLAQTTGLLTASTVGDQYYVGAVTVSTR